MSILVYVVILFMLGVTLIASARARAFQLRRIEAYSSMPLNIGEAVESDKAVHVSFGASSVREVSTVSALASAGILYYLAERAALADKSPLVTLSDPVTLTLGLDTLRRAYKLGQTPREYRLSMVRWYPQGPLSLAFAAGVGAAILEEDISTNILVGRFGSEVMLIAENAVRYNRQLVAQSDQLDGQAVGYVVSDSPLIGEELYAGDAYLSRTPLGVGGAVSQDVLRYIVVALIIGLFFLATLGANF